MIKNIEVEFKPSGEEMANELWQMDCGQQTEFLYEISRTQRITPSLFLTQLQYVADEINGVGDVYNKASIVRMLETVLEYIKEGDEKKSCLNCGSSECELGNRARYGFCGNWTMKEGEQE